MSIYSLLVCNLQVLLCVHLGPFSFWCLLLFLLQGFDGLVSKWYFRGSTIFCNLSSVNIRLR